MAAGSEILSDRWGNLAQLPGFRTFRSSRFRLVVGILLVLVGLAMAAVLVYILAREPTGADTVGARTRAQYGLDFGDYRTASLRMLEGRSPYAPEMLEAPIPAQGVDRYRYPPTFAQLLTPIAILPFGVGATIWLAVQLVCLYVACWLAASAGGARPSLERFVWTGVALAYFLPVFAGLWLGNVGGPMALSVAVVLAGARGIGRGVLAGGFAAGAILLKVAPIVLLPAIFRVGGRMAVGLFVGLAALIVPSAAVAPQAWLDYLRVFPNLIAGHAVYANNLAPATVLLNAGAPGLWVDAVRALTLVAAGALVISSIGMASRSSSWPAAVGCSVVAALLLPASLWYHYLVLLLPLAFFAWGKAGSGARLALVASAALVSVGLNALPLATLGGGLMAVTSVSSVRRR